MTETIPDVSRQHVNDGIQRYTSWQPDCGEMGSATSAIVMQLSARDAE